MPFDFGIDVYNGDDNFVFISYRTDDGPMLTPYVQSLSELGYNIWYDRAITGGHDYKEFLMEKIPEASAMVFFATRNSILSKDIGNELHFAFEADVFVIPVYFDVTYEDLPASFKWSLAPYNPVYAADGDIKRIIGDIDRALKCSVAADKSPKESVLTGDEYLSLGDDYSLGKNGKERDPKSAADMYKMGAEKGSAEASLKYGICLYTGSGTDAAPAEAAKYFETAVKAGVGIANFWLGECYFDGKAFPRNYDEAMYYYREAAKFESARAMFRIGTFFAEAFSVRRNLSDAANWYEKAGDLGDAEAIYTLGKCYFTGQGRPKNFEDAYRMYDRASSLDYAPAMQSKAMCCLDGLGIRKNLALAEKTLKDAIAMGYVPSMRELARLYLDGALVPPDDSTASGLLQRAAELGDVQAKKMLEENF